MNNKKKILALLLMSSMVVPYARTFATANSVAKTIEDDKNINLTGDKVLQAQKEGALLIDVRENKEYKEGHIKGAINIFVDNIETKISTYVNEKDKKIVLYCNTGNKSKKAYDKLKKLGYTNIFNGQGVRDYNYELVKDEENLNKLQIKVLDKNNNAITQPVEALIYDSWGSEDDGYTITSKNGILDFTKVVEDPNFDDQTFYAIKIKVPKDSKILNLSDNEEYKNTFNFKQDDSGEYTVKKFLKDGTSSAISELVLDIKNKDEITYDKGQEVTLEDITVVDEEGKALTDGTKFETFNKENKDMLDYTVQNGKLIGVKAKVGDRMKLGVKEETQKDFTLMDKGKKSAYFNYVWFKVNEKGKAIRFDDVTGENLTELTKITAIHKNKLVGAKPAGEKVKYDINVYDITAKKPVLNDEVKFSITGDGETRELVSKNAIVQLELYKNTKYTITLVRTMKNSYKMNGFSFTLDDSGVLKGEDGKDIKTLNVYQGLYLVRVYTLYKGNFAPEGLEFYIVEDGTKNTQTRKTEGKFLNFDTEINKSYTISIKENTFGYEMEPVHITMKKHLSDGLYWATLDEDKTPKGDDGKLKAFFLKKAGEKLDLSIPNGGCGNSDCVINTELIKPQSLTVKTSDNSNVDGMIFKLFNSTTQNYEEDVKVENGKINLNIHAQNKYFLQLVNDKYSAFNTYIQANKNGDILINPKTDKEVKEISVTKKAKEEKSTNRYKASVQVMYKGKPVDGVTLKFIGENDTFEATCKNGTVEFDLLEDVTYVVKSLDEKYETLTFPLVLKDKMEWGILGDKRLFDHTSCNSVSAITLYDKGTNVNNGSIISPLGDVKINGMRFNNLNLDVESLNKEDFSSISKKDVDVLDIMLINPFRCEKTKILSGNFTIQKTLITNKEVKKVYYIDDNEKQIELKFEQSGQFLSINANEIGSKKLVIEYKNKNDLNNDNTNPNTNNSNGTTSNDINNNGNINDNSSSTNNTNTKKEIEFIKGENQTIKANSNEKLSFEIDANINDFLKAYVDGVVVDKSMYTVKKGSTIVDFKEEFLNTLKSGQHEFKFEFKQGVAVANVVIENKKDEEVNNKNDNKKGQNIPKTSIALSTSFTTVALAIAGAFTSLKKRK